LKFIFVVKDGDVLTSSILASERVHDGSDVIEDGNDIDDESEIVY
jgi:hypothetical protein